jgi:Serine dehydrogenase proteinase
MLLELGHLQKQAPASANPGDASPFDLLRRKYLGNLHAYTGRAVIIYYSGWLENKNYPPSAVQVQLGDLTGFMEACSNAKERELDLFLHSPGGAPDAAESAMGYLRTQFDHIRAVVPMAAMSAATMMALSADEILMGAHSQLGPIDPQLTVPTPEGLRSAPGQAIEDQFERAKAECQDPKNLTAWVPLLRSLAPGLLSVCDATRAQAEEIVERALAAHMLAGDPEGAAKAKAAAAWFADFKRFKSHGRRISRDEARSQAIVVHDLEDDQQLQDLVLSVHHAALHTLAGTGTVKIIENHHGRAFVNVTTQSVQIELPIPANGPAKPAQIPAGTLPGLPGGPALNRQQRRHPGR